jgi:hypothetical protein
MLHNSQLKLKVYGNITLQREGLIACAAYWSGREPNMTWKFGCTHHWIGMDGDQQVLIILAVYTNAVIVVLPFCGSKLYSDV